MVEDCFKYFIATNRCFLGKPCLLMVSSHGTHTDLSAIKLALCKGVHVVTFFAHCSIRLQPLDVAVFRPLRVRLRTVQTFLTIYSRRVTIYGIAGLVYAEITYHGKYP